MITNNYHKPIKSRSLKSKNWFLFYGTVFLENLKNLSLNGARVTDHGLVYLGTLNSLETLWLGGTMVTDDGIKRLGALHNLKWLFLGNTRVTQAGVTDLKDSLPKCRIIRR